MKAFVLYDDVGYLVSSDDFGIPNYNELFDFVNKSRWPDECQTLYSIQNDSKILAYFTDQSELVV